LESVGAKLSGMGFPISGAASAVYPSANLAIYVPFYLLTPCTVAQVFWYNGATQTDSVDFGIYSADGRQLLHTGAIALSGANALQTVDVTDTQIGEGLNWMAIAQNGTTGALFAVALANIGLTCLTGIYQQGTAYTLPATATFADPTFDYIPVMGFTPRSVV
jgi:hypothetical protein